MTTPYRPARLNVCQTPFSSENLQFGNVSLQVFPNSNITFKILSDLCITKEQQCLLDNFWSSFNRQPQDKKYHLACLNALSQYFHASRNQFKFYTVISGNLLGVFATWNEVIDSIKNVPKPMFKGFGLVSEAIDYARKYLGDHFYLSPSLRQLQFPISQPSHIAHDTKSKILFCDHCETLAKTIKTLNQNTDVLIKEKQDLIFQLAGKDREIALLKQKLAGNQGNSSLTMNPPQLVTPSHFQPTNSKTSATQMSATNTSDLQKQNISYSQIVSATNSKMRASRLIDLGKMVTTEPIRTVASPEQTATGKDFSNPLMAEVLPKNLDPLCVTPTHSATKQDSLCTNPVHSATQSLLQVQSSAGISLSRRRLRKRGRKEKIRTEIIEEVARQLKSILQTEDKQINPSSNRERQLATDSSSPAHTPRGRISGLDSPDPFNSTDERNLDT